MAANLVVAQAMLATGDWLVRGGVAAVAALSALGLLAAACADAARTRRPGASRRGGGDVAADVRGPGS
ncbi:MULTISPECIES: hypothetical protein [Streptomyces]|uniref:hypothetical protein n=1 Tax=Streptomyces TaxID=1883 RepID=UPI002248FB93|nr:hypothetical protein [Streptomyces sp. JHD 1]MCX2970409.1 hypothetical protein [Streptomyces sp. JHD 1]